MKQNSFPSKEELLLQCNTIKRRQERIIQVRQQSKQMSAAILDKVKREAQRQCEEIESQVLSEIRNYHQKELEYSRQQYEKCISEINQRHYLQQIDINNKNSQTSSKKTLRNSSPVKNAPSTNNDGKGNNPVDLKTNLKSLEQRTNTARNTNKKLNEKKVRLSSTEKSSRNIIIDSDDDGVRKHTILNFRKHSPEVKHLKSLQGDENRSRCRRKSPCSNTHKPKLIHSKAIDDHVLINDKSSKAQIDEMYNQLVHDRIRILEQKDKILDRRTMFLPNGISTTEKTPRFSEYFARFHSAKISSTNIPLSTSRKETEIKEIMDDMKRVERKKKLLKDELSKPKDANNSKTISLTEETQHDRKQHSPLSSEKPITNSSSDKNSPVSNSDDSSSRKTSPRNRLCPSPIPKTAINDKDSSLESNKKLKLSKHRHCRRKSRSQAIQITVSKDKKSIISSFNDNTTNTQQNGTNSSSSTSKDFQQNLAQPVKLVVNVLPSADCRIEIKNNTSEKRYVRATSKQHAEKVKDWRTIFKNQDKLTESSYYSPPEYNKKIENVSSQEYERQKVKPSSTVASKDIGFYVRKLLLMSPESVDNLNVSSCNTTLIEDSSRTTSIDSNTADDIPPQHRIEPPPHKVSSTQTEPQKNQLHDTENNRDDNEHVKELLLRCLKLATVKSDDINLTTFKSIDSSCDNKSFGNFPKASELNDSNTSYENFITTAIQRLLPLYQNSLDDNLDVTANSQQTVNRTEDQSEIIISKESARVSTSAYPQKFVPSLSNTSEKPNTENRDIIEYLKQYIESQSSPEKDDKILEDSYDSANDVPSKDASYISLPSVDELIRKGLISKAYALDDTQNEPKEFIDEEEFVRKMLQVNFTSKESHSKVDADQSKDNNNDNHLSEPDDRYATDIRQEFRKLGLNWMDTTLQRTLQASVINSTSSAEDSAGPLRSDIHFSSGYQASVSSNLIIPQHQPKQLVREVLNISPITVPDLQLSVPHCFRKN